MSVPMPSLREQVEELITKHLRIRIESSGDAYRSIFLVSRMQFVNDLVALLQRLVPDREAFLQRLADIPDCRGRRVKDCLQCQQVADMAMAWAQGESEKLVWCAHVVWDHFSTVKGRLQQGWCLAGTGPIVEAQGWNYCPFCAKPRPEAR